MHVRDELAGRCYPGVIMAPGPAVSRVRVLRYSTGGFVGNNDEEGDMRSYPTIVPNPPYPDGTPGGFRTLDWWHPPADCPDLARLT